MFFQGYTACYQHPSDATCEVSVIFEGSLINILCVVKHLELLDSSMLHMRPEVAKEIVAYNYG